LPVALTKRELVKRAAKWGAPRGFELRDSLLNAWIDEGLVDEGDRGGNVGKRPAWRLQILKPALGGILSKDPEIPAEIDQIMANATDADLTLSASILNLFRAVLSWLESKTRSPEIAGLLSGLLASFSQPEFIAAHFALQLTLLKRFPVDKGELEEFLRFANRGFS
jgi:hypothetical protein